MATTSRVRRRLAVAGGLLALLALLLWWLLRADPAESVAAAPAGVPAAAPPIAAPPPGAPPPVGAAAAAAPALPGEVRCPIHLEEPVEGQVEVAVALDAGTPGITRWDLAGGEIRGTDLVFRDNEATSLHLAKVTVPGYLPQEIRWTPRDGGFDCPEVELRRGAVVVGTVRPKPRAIDDFVRVHGCGGSTHAAEDGTFYLEATPEPCTLVAEREDGWYRVTSREVHVVPRMDAEVEVTLALPEAEQAGLGLELEPVPEGMRVARLRSDGAAVAGGLRPGDVLVAIDGVDLAGATIAEANAAALGDVGGEVDVVVLRDGVREERTLTREFVPDDHELVLLDPSEMRRMPVPGAWLD